MADVMQTDLECRDWPSDKVYSAVLVEVDDGWKVKFTYGPRYGARNTYMKPEGPPVIYEDAAALLIKQVKAKRRKGYVDR